MPENKKLTDIPNLRVSYFHNLVNSLAYKINAFVTPGMFLPAVDAVRWADVVHLHDFYTPQHIWIGLLCRVFRKPFILSVHGCLEQQRMQARSFMKRAILVLYGKQLLLTASKLIATSENEAAAYRSYGVKSDKIFFLGHGISSAEFHSQLTKIEARRKLKLPSGKIIVTYLGRIHAIKGLDLLVTAIDDLKSTGIHFVIAGSNDGYLPQLLTDIASRRLSKIVTRMGTCFGVEKANLFKASDIFVYPSYSEGFSLGILEAAASGLPLVLTKGCHFEEAAKVGAAIVVPADHKKLADAIMKFARNKALRDSSAKHAKDLVSSKYSMDAIGKQLSVMYSQVIDG